MQLYEWTYTHTHACTHTDDRQWVEMKDLEFHPVTLCSRWRAGQARPGLSQERKSERERGEERRWGRCRKEGWGTKLLSFFLSFFFNLRERTCLFSFFFPLTPSWLPRGTESFSSLLLFLCSSSHHLSAPSSPLLPSWGYTWAQPRRLQPQLTRRKEAEDRGGKRWEQRERWSMEYFGDILTEKIDQRTFFCCCFTWKNYNHVCLGGGAVYSD